MPAALGPLPAGFVVNVFVRDGMAGVGAPLSQLSKLVLGVLAFLIGTDASVDSYAHGHGSLPVEKRVPFYMQAGFVKCPFHAGFLVGILPTLFP
jgi:hypothetical protein